MADAESISLEETNKIRISLGLAPLKPDSEVKPVTDEHGNVLVTADEEERQAVQNLKNLRAEQAKLAEENAFRQRLKKSVFNPLVIANWLIFNLELRTAKH